MYKLLLKEFINTIYGCTQNTQSMSPNWIRNLLDTNWINLFTLWCDLRINILLLKQIATNINCMCILWRTAGYFSKH